MQYSRRFVNPVFFFLLVSLATSAFAGKFVPIIGGEKNKEGSYLVINGVRVMQFRTSNGKHSAAERTQIVIDRLTTLVQQGLDSKTITLKSNDQEARIFAGEMLLAIVTPAEAKAQDATPTALAEQWADNIVSALSLPPLDADPKTMLVPVGEARAIAVKSLLKSPVQFDSSDPNIASVDCKTKPGFMIVKGIKPGDLVLTLKCEDYTVKVQVATRKYAALKSRIKVESVVTGKDAPKSLVAQAALEAAGKSVQLEPGARIQSASVSDPIGPLSPGKSIQASVQVDAVGDQYIPAKLSIPVTISNRLIPAGTTSSIFYSNNPEQISKYQYLFIGETETSERPYRLLYHHQNKMGRRIGFVVDVVNTASTSGSLHVVEGIANPILDTVIVGYRAGLDFMENLRSNIGYVIDLPPHTRQVLVGQALESGNTASGLLEIHQLSGDPLLVRVLTKPEEQRLSEDSEGTNISAVGIDRAMFGLSDDVYPNPQKKMEATYVAGKPWLFLRMGKEAIKHATHNTLLYGNYGVTYDIKARIENPLSQPYEAEIAFEATAGPASGVFYLDGALVKFRLLKSTEEATIGKIKIPPGKTRTVDIRTIPLSGSAYPATIIIRPTIGSRMMQARK